MITSFMSTASLSESTRIALAKAQARMADAQAELASGRHADVGKTLGATTEKTVSLRQKLAQLQTIRDTNSQLEPQLKFSQTALQDVQEAASTFLTAVVGASGSGQAASVAQRAGEDALRGLTGLLNTSYDGGYLFAGINTSVEPLTDYFGPASSNKAAADAAFLAEFGFAKDDPAVATISAASMRTFLDGAFEALFDPAAWSASWSAAADQNTTVRISSTEIIESSANANEAPVRKLAMAFTMIADLGLENLSDAARDVVFDKAMKLTAEASAGVTGMRANIGLAEDRTARATERLGIQTDIIETNIGKLESVDPAEVSVRITALMTQIETSYSLTARLHQMSLVKYL